MTSLSGTVQLAPNQSLGFDANSVISLSVAQQFAAQGYHFCVRYLSRNTPQASGDLSNGEASNILAGGLALMAVQHVQSEGWVPSAELGSSYGSNAATNAQQIGLPAGMNIWLDLEGVAAGTSSQIIIEYCTNWYDQVEAAGYIPGIYVGANCGLSGNQLYDLPFQHYWQSLSNVPAIPERGYQMVQSGVAEPVNGIGIDQDVVQVDNEGGAPLWLVQ